MTQLHLAPRPPVGLAMSLYFRAVAGLLQIVIVRGLILLVQRLFRLRLMV